MVNGHALKPLVVVDLDGTLIYGNSLRLYARCAVSDALRRRRPLRAMRLLGIMGLRLCRLYSHRRMKWRLFQTAGVSAGLQAEFTRRIKADMRADVAAILSEKERDGAAVLLASAAFDFYIPWFWTGPYLATKTLDNPGRVELRGENKLRAVQRYADRNGFRLDTVLTDHSDDLALLAAPFRQRILVSPSASTRASVAMAGIIVDSFLY